MFKAKTLTKKQALDLLEERFAVCEDYIQNWCLTETAARAKERAQTEENRQAQIKHITVVEGYLKTFNRLFERFLESDTESGK